MKKKKKKYRLQWFGIDETRTKDCSRTTPLSIDRGIRLKLPVHRFFFLTATNNRKEISTLCRLVEKSLVRGNRCIRSGIYNPFPFPFVSFSFPSKNALAEGKEWRTNRWQISFYSFSFPNSLFKHNIQQNLMDRQICICYPFIFIS